MKSSDSRTYLLIFWIANLCFAFVRILFSQRPELDLFTEEAQYWLWSRNLDWNYYSKPPMVAVLNYLSTTLLGHTELAIRMIPILFGLGTAWIVFAFARLRFGSDKLACIAGLLFLGMPIHLLEFTFHTTDTSMTFFWTGCWYLLYRAIHHHDTKAWGYAGLVAALGILSKATMILVFPASLLYLLAFGQVRLFIRPWLGFLGLALLGFIPSLIWNFQHDFYTFKHLAALGGASSGEPKAFDFGLLVSRTSEYLGGQLAMFSVFFLPFFYLGIRKLIRTKEGKDLFPILPGLLTFLGFGGLSLLTWVEVNWPGFTYSTLPVFLAPILVEAGAKWKTFGKWAIGISLALPFLLLSPNFLGWKSQGPLFKAEKALFKRTVGYEELGQRIDALQDSLQLTEPILFSESYHIASELAFYVQEHPQTYVANMGTRKNQWDLWPGMDLYLNQPKTFIFVSRNQSNPTSVAKFQRLIYEEELPYFYRIDSLGKTKIQVWEHLLEYNPVNLGTF